MEDESTLEALRRLSMAPERYGSGIREDIRTGMQDFEDTASSNPQDDIVGPALATGSSFIRDMMLPEVDYSGPREGVTPAMFGANRMLTKAAKPIKDARAAALKDIAKAAPSRARAAEMKRLSELNDVESIKELMKTFPKMSVSGVDPVTARTILKLRATGQEAEAIAKINSLNKASTYYKP
jgi:hypothetical protein